MNGSRRRTARATGLGLMAALAFAATVALAGAATQNEKLAAIGELLRNPGTNASQTLQGMATGDPDLYVRENAILALAQLGGLEALPALYEIGANPPSANLLLAVRSTVHELRRRFPLPNPPVVTLTAVGALSNAKEFDVEATVTSPVDRDHVRIRFNFLESLRSVKQAGASEIPGYQGKLKAGVPVVIRGRFVAPEPVRTELALTVQVNLNSVDTTTYRTPFYLDFIAKPGTASLTPPAGY